METAESAAWAAAGIAALALVVATWAAVSARRSARAADRSAAAAEETAAIDRQRRAEELTLSQSADLWHRRVGPEHLQLVNEGKATATQVRYGVREGDGLPFFVANDPTTTFTIGPNQSLDIKYASRHGLGFWWLDVEWKDDRGPHTRACRIEE